MNRNAKTLVGLLGRRFIRDHHKQFLNVLGLDEDESITSVKHALKAQVTVTTLRAKFRLSPDAPMQDVAKAVETHVRHLKDLEVWNITPNGDEDKELDALNRAWYMAGMCH